MDDDIPVYEPRRSPRLAVEIMALVDQPRSGQVVQAGLTVLSNEGCRIEADETFERGAQVLLIMPEHDPWPARVVWSEGGAMALEFHTALPEQVVADYAARFGSAG